MRSESLDERFESFITEMRSESSNAQSNNSEVRNTVLRTPLHRTIPQFERVDVVMETKGGKKKSSSSSTRSSRSSSLQYEAPLGYSIEDIRPNGGIEKFRSAAYSNCVRKPS
ncbi:hypothetical protein RHMOL_Rhmol01G0017500 [Rhododendron molle]|uniref:Uncharacterized protein n=1 Tax=Rhododendron molle TaxID=49168 RepID=A0ACC0PYJ7_RHOML|nr:hypothetical protein RHMOL_Rhmol01G0017500 [Rhododendron molle]